MHERGNGDETVSRSARLAERVWFPVSPGRGDEASPDGLRAEGDSAYSVDARGAMGVQVGDGNTQIIYAYGQLTWTDGVAPPPLVSRSGVVDSPYRGLGAFEERDAGFFFGREDAVAQVLERMSRLLARGGLLVVSGAPGAEDSLLGVQPEDPLPQPDLDVEAVVIVGRTEPGAVPLAPQHLLGQWRAVVGRVRLGAEQDDAALVTPVPQPLDGAQAGQAGADDGD